MPFLKEVLARLQSGNLSKEMEVFLSYMKDHGVGRDNPVPTETILAILTDAGYMITPNRFQTSLLNAF